MDNGKALPHVVRVLVCDDNRDIADSLADLLQFCGYEVVTCYRGAAALAAVDGGFRPDACLLDLEMPGMDGDELAVLLRVRLGDAPPLLVAVTGLSADEAGPRIGHAGFHAHMVKPADPARLLAALSRLDR
jgi:two-component system OmpR family response regulator